MEPQVENAGSDELSLGALIRRLIVGLAVLVIAAFVIGLTLRKPIEWLSAIFVENFGVAGIFTGVLVLDSIPFTMSEPLLLLGYAGGLGFWYVVLTASTASWLSGLLGWVIGRIVGQSEVVQAIFKRNKITPFMQRYGSFAIGVAALTPFPFAIATWSAGATKVPLSTVMISSLLRYPKTILYMSLVVWGWMASV